MNKSIAFALAAAVALPVYSADTMTAASAKVAEAQNVSGSNLPANLDAVTSASVVPQALRQEVKPNGFTNSSAKKNLFVVGDPRHESVEWDLVNTAVKHFMDKGVEVEVRDLYEMNFDPVLRRDTFFNAKDGFGETPKDVAVEQKFVSAADFIIFAYPNWHDSPNAITKGYMERVFAKKYAYQDSAKGLEGLLKGKAIFTLMNAGWIGMGRGDVGEGIGKGNVIWDRYLNAYKVVDDDTAGFWGTKNLGRFVNDRTPANTAQTYAKDLEALRTSLIEHLDKKFGL